jgi:hypothetical protein
MAEPSALDHTDNAARSARAGQDSPAIVATNLLVGILGGSVLLASVYLFSHDPWTFSFWDGLFWGAVVLLLGARALQLRVARSITGAVGGSWWRFAGIVVGITAVVWVVGQSVRI